MHSKAGAYSVEVKNNLAGSTFTKVGSTDPTQAVLTVEPATTLSPGTTKPVECCDVAALNRALNASVGKATRSNRIVVQLGPGVWAFGAEDSLIIPDGVHVQGAGTVYSV